MRPRAIALVFAAIALGIAIARWPRRTAPDARPRPWMAAVLVPIAIIIGTVPGLLGLGDTVHLLASLTSIVFSVAAIGLMLARKSGDGGPV